MCIIITFFFLKNNFSVHIAISGNCGYVNEIISKKKNRNNYNNLFYNEIAILEKTYVINLKVIILS